MKSNHIEVNDLKLHYIEKGEGYPLIFLHGGITIAEENWENQIDFFSESFRVIATDSRGHGKTNNPSGEFSYRLMADDIAALIRKLKLEKPLRWRSNSFRDWYSFS